VLYDRTRPKPVAVFTGHIDRFASLAFSPDGKSLAVSGKPGIQLWDVTSHRISTLTPARNELSGVAFSPNGKTLADIDMRRIRLWDVASRRIIDSVSSFLCKDLAFSPDGKTLAIALVDRTILRNVADHRNSATLDGSSQSVAFSPDGKTLATGTYEGGSQVGPDEIRLWRLP
jgi:WD40 repeat protein